MPSQAAQNRVARDRDSFPMPWIPGDLIDVQIPLTNVMSQSPGQVQVLAARVFRVNRHSPAARVIYLKRYTIERGSCIERLPSQSLSLGNLMQPNNS